MAAGGKNPVTPFIGGTSVFPNTDLTATPGSASAAVEWTDVADVTVAAPITVASDNTIGHATSGVTPGTYGDSTHYPIITVEADGHVTAASVDVVPTPPVTSVFGRTGAVVAQTGDYTVAEVTGAAPLASPALTGTPTAPTNATATDASTQIATDAFVQAAIAHFGYLPETGGTMTGTLVLAGLNYTITLVNDANYTLTGSETIIIYTALTTVRFIEIPPGLPVGQVVLVLDASGSVVAGTKEIQLDFLTGVTGNGNSNCCYTFINQAFGQGTVICRASNTWSYTGNAWPLWLTSTSRVTFNGLATASGNWIFDATSGIAISLQGSSSLGIQTNIQTISGTLTLGNNASNFQAINGGAADRTVNLPFTNGNFFWIWNTGTTNNLLITVNSHLVYSLPPGRSGLFSYDGNGTSFTMWNGSAANLRFAKDLTAQAVAQSAVALDTAPSNGAGIYRISWAAIITQASDGTSSLGGTNGFQVAYTDNDTGASATTPAGAVSTANAVGTQLNGTALVNAKVSTAITFSFDYASVFTTTTMKYALHVRSEYLG